MTVANNREYEQHLKNKKEVLMNKNAANHQSLSQELLPVDKDSW